MVFQSYALFPHMNVWRTSAYGLRSPACQAPTREERAAEKPGAGRPLGLREALPERAVRRPAAARRGRPRDRARAEGAAVRRAAVQSRRQAAPPRRARRSASLQQRLGLTVVYVTHDQEEALAVSDRIIVMKRRRASPRTAAHATSTNAPPTASSPISSATPTSCPSPLSAPMAARPRSRSARWNCRCKIAAWPPERPK